MLHYAVLIDGGFAKRKLGSSVKPATAEQFRALITALTVIEPLSSMRLHRVYYYDSIPLETTHERPLQGGQEAFGGSPVASRSRALFEALGKMPYVALRLGELTFNGWSVAARKLERSNGDSVEIRAADLRPNITQKGVDMRVGMDIAALTLKKQVQVIVLVSGDSDFVPAMRFARREGAQLFLCSLGQHVRPSMLEHSDLTLAIDPRGLDGPRPDQ